MIWQIIKRIFKYLFIFFIVFTAYTSIILFLLKFINPPITAFMQQNNEYGIIQLIQPSINKQTWIPVKSIAKTIIFATIAAEDQRFLLHRGVDFVELEKVLKGRLKNGKSRGASTITQQVAKNLFLFPQKNVLRKIIEIYYSYLIDFIWGKKRVIEVYLNVAQFGKNIYGVEEASLYYFRKPAQYLNSNEASQLAAILPNPIRFNLKNKSKYLNNRIKLIEKSLNQIDRKEILELLK